MEIYKIENATMMDSIEIVCEVRQSKVVNEDEDVQVEKMEVSENWEGQGERKKRKKIVEEKEKWKQPRILYTCSCYWTCFWIEYNHTLMSYNENYSRLHDLGVVHIWHVPHTILKLGYLS